MFKGKFKTAYLQREIPMDAIIIDDMVCGELVKVTPATGTTPAIVEKLVAETETAAVAEATHILAQSDMTLAYGHVPVENMDYKYEGVVESTADMTKVLPGSTNVFHGVFLDPDDLPEASAAEGDGGATVGDTALVAAQAGDTVTNALVLYVLTHVTDANIWKEQTNPAKAYSIPYSNTKPIAAYKIITKLDVYAVDED